MEDEKDEMLAREVVEGEGEVMDDAETEAEDADMDAAASVVESRAGGSTRMSAAPAPAPRRPSSYPYIDAR
eukprot:7578899-Prorocentrum_lima.AAC.1